MDIRTIFANPYLLGHVQNGLALLLILSPGIFSLALTRRWLHLQLPARNGR